MRSQFKTMKLSSALLGLMFCLSACSTTPEKPDGPNVINGQSNLPPKKAIEEFEKAVKIYESSKGKDLDGVEDSLEEAVSVDKNFARAWFNLGIVYERKGDKKKAREAYENAAAAGPKFGPPHVNLGKLSMDAGDRAAAISQFQQAISKDSFNSQAHNNMCVIMREDKNYEQAVQHARQSLAGDASNTGAYANLALTYYEMGYNDVAKLVILNALKITEDDADLWNTYGLIELKNNDVTSAISHFTKATTLKKDHVAALLNLGAIVLSVRDYERAIKLFEEVLKYDKGNLEAQISIAVAKRGLGELKEAEALYKSVLEKDRENYLAIFNLAVLEHEHLAQATLLGIGGPPAPDDPVKQMEWNISNMNNAIKNYEKARDYYSNFLQVYKGDKYRKEAEERIAQVQELITLTRAQIDDLTTAKQEVAQALEEEKRLNEEAKRAEEAAKKAEEEAKKAGDATPEGEQPKP